MNAAADGGEARSRYVVGIDLGTTNSAMAFVDTEAEPRRIETFAIPQLVAPGVVEPRDTLPSYHYAPSSGELPPGALRLPWSTSEPEHAVGVLARELGSRVPGRLISSAKSWLCHAGVDRLAELLPWHGAADVPRLSPVEASARYLAHLRAAWNHRFPNDPLEAQEVVLTLPASFDEVARELSIKAAALAGLPRVVPIEEPQAAFYCWIDAHGDRWEQLIRPGQKILVVDIGGGTSDFTLIRAQQAGGGKVQFQRVAVGEHLILGGDNLDLALAKHVEGRLGTSQLEPRQWAVLVQLCRQAKETLLGENAPGQLSINLPASGARLVGGALRVELSREEVHATLVDGFLPRVEFGAKPAARRSGFQEFGLPYAPDAAITRYLGAFLRAHADKEAGQREGNAARPDVVLFNGGFFASPVLRARLVEALAGWFQESEPGWQPTVLDSERLDLAVARGAAYYGLVRRGLGVRISANLARSYFVGVRDAQGQAAAMCLVPAGVEEGQSVELSDYRFELLLRQPVEFPLYVSSTLTAVRPGQMLAYDPEQLTALPPIRTVLELGKKRGGPQSRTVILHARLTEIGTLDMWCSEVEGSGVWRLQFDVRAATQTDVTGHTGTGEQAGIVDERVASECRAMIGATFGSDAEKPEGLAKRLAAATEQPRNEWPPTLLRSLWEALVEHEAGRRRSPTHEARWLNLLGFSLRPGFGVALDDWRVGQTWRLLQGKLVHPGPMGRAEWWILWRRIAAGLPAGQQRALAEPLLGELRNAQRSVLMKRGANLRYTAHEGAELWRMLGSLELLAPSWKLELGGIILDLAAGEKLPAMRAASLWALGRLAAREPLHGPLNAVVGPEVAETWIERALKLRDPPETLDFFLLQAARRTHDRYRDVSERVRREVLDRLAGRDAPSHYLELVREGGELARDEQGLVFGESLPAGLVLTSAGHD